VSFFYFFSIKTSSTSCLSSASKEILGNVLPAWRYQYLAFQSSPSARCRWAWMGCPSGCWCPEHYRAIYPSLLLFDPRLIWAFYSNFLEVLLHQEFSWSLSKIVEMTLSSMLLTV